MTPIRSVLVNEEGVTYSVLGRSRWSLRWSDILAVQAYAKGTSTYRVGFRLESSGRDAELNTREDLLSKRDIIDAFRTVAAVARRRAIEVGDPLGWLPEEEGTLPGRDQRVAAVAGGGRMYLSREPARALGIAGSASILLIFLALATFLPGQVPQLAVPVGLGLTLIILGVGIGFAVPLAYADSIIGLRVTRHGLGLRLASGRDYIVRWTDVERIVARPDEGHLIIATGDGRRRPAWMSAMDCREIVAWLLATRSSVLQLIEPRCARAGQPVRDRLTHRPPQRTPPTSPEAGGAPAGAPRAR